MASTILVMGDPARYTNYSRAVKAAGGRACFSDSSAPESVYSGLLLPGGGDIEPWRYGQSNTASGNLNPERDAAEFALLDRFIAAKKPVLGICRGFQLINVYFGGTLTQDIPDHSSINGSDRLHPVRTAPSFLSRLCGESAVVNSAHHQAAKQLGRGLRAIQWAPDGIVEALVHQALPVWGVQWHPERLAENDFGQLLFKAFLELCCQES